MKYNEVHDQPGTIRLTWVAMIAGAYAVIGGTVTFIGWATGVYRLTDWYNFGISMKTNPAIASIACGLALIIAASSERKSIGRVAVAWLGGVAALIGGLTLSQHLFGWNLGIDTLLFDEPPGERATFSPNRMGIPGSTSFLLLGSAIVFLRGDKWRWLAATLAVTVATITAVSMVGYLYGAEDTYTLRLTGIALQTATILFVLSLGVIAVVSEVGPMRLLRDPGSAGVLVRMALPIIIISPLILGALRVAIQDAGLVDTALGTALRTVIEIGLLCALLWWAAHYVWIRDRSLRRLAQELRLVTDAVPALISYIDAAGCYRFNNKAYEDWFGHRREEIVGKHMREVLGQAAYERLRPHIETALAGRRAHFEDEIPYRDGGTRFIQADYVPDIQPNGAVAGYYVLVADITQRKHAELALLESEARHRQLADSVSVLVWGCRRDGANDFFNNRWFEFTGLTYEESCGDGWTKVLHPKDRQRTFERWTHCLRTGEPYQAEFRLRRADGEYRWCLSDGLPMRDEQGTVARWYGTCTDIHDLKQAEQALRESEDRFRALIDNIPQLAWMAEPGTQGKATWFNKAWLDYTGTTIEQNQGSGWQAVHHPDHAARVIAKFEHHVREGLDWEDTFPLRARDGSFRWFLSRMNVTRDLAGKAVRIFGTNTDITEQREALEQAAHNARMKDEFIATLSHELRTPMAAIYGWAQMLQRGRLKPEETRQGIEVIERNARMQSQIIDDLLDTNRILAGKMRLEVQSVAIGEVIEAAIESIRPAAEARAIRIHFVCDPSVHDVRGDPNRLQQVIYNLLSNAVKFTPPQGKVQVACQRVNSNIEVSVGDTGQGIDPAFLPFVFERFRQQDASITRSSGGLGLGLSIVKYIVELHGGKVQVASEGEGKGATFTIHLPVAVVLKPELPTGELEREHPVAAAAGGSRTRDPDAIDTTALKGRSILVVDDERDARELIAKVLEDRGVKCLLAASGEEAIKFFDSGADPLPDLIISDLGMPGMNGYDLIEKVRALGPQRGGSVAAIALTAFARPEDRTRSLLAGFQMHLSKPVEIYELLANIVSLTDKT